MAERPVALTKQMRHRGDVHKDHTGETEMIMVLAAVALFPLGLLGLVLLMASLEDSLEDGLDGSAAASGEAEPVAVPTASQPNA